jgi:hypothetical protein
MSLDLYPALGCCVTQRMPRKLSERQGLDCISMMVGVRLDCWNESGAYGNKHLVAENRKMTSRLVTDF